MQLAYPLKRTQRGVTMIGFLFVAIVFIAVAVLAMKLFPAYTEFFSVKKILSTMGQDSDLKTKSNAEIREDFSRRANVGYVTVVKPEDITIDRKGGSPVVSVDYEFRTPLVANVSLIVDFSASSDPNAAPAGVE
ncbi:MAG: DUF4845 domain-containing protein [Thiobacillus sp.]